METIPNLANSVSKISLKGGLAGKICYVLIVVTFVLGAIVYFTKNIWITWFVAIAIVVLVFYFLCRLCSLAERNPQAALMEGAEYLLHEQLTFQTKNNPTSNWSPLDNKLAGNIDVKKLQNVDKPDLPSLDKGKEE